MGWAVLAGEAATFPSGEATINAHLGRPAAPGRYPAFIAVHGIYGLEAGNRRAVERLAEEGYVGLAIDWQSHEPDPHDSDLVRYVGDAAAFLQRQEHVDPERIAVGGYCRGGRVVYLALAEYPWLRAGVAYHATLPREPDPRTYLDPFEVVGRIRAPVLMLHGAADDRSPLEHTFRMAQRLEGLEKTFTLKVYSGAGHAFTLPGGTAYAPEAASDAWDETVRFLDRYVRR
jgi:carboxymethylenebutenolidase